MLAAVKHYKECLAASLTWELKEGHWQDSAVHTTTNFDIHAKEQHFGVGGSNGWKIQDKLMGSPVPLFICEIVSTFHPTTCLPQHL